MRAQRESVFDRAQGVGWATMSCVIAARLYLPSSEVSLRARFVSDLAVHARLVGVTSCWWRLRASIRIRVPPLMREAERCQPNWVVARPR